MFELNNGKMISSYCFCFFFFANNCQRIHYLSNVYFWFCVVTNDDKRPRHFVTEYDDYLNESA